MPLGAGQFRFASGTKMKLFYVLMQLFFNAHALTKTRRAKMQINRSGCCAPMAEKEAFSKLIRAWKKASLFLPKCPQSGQNLFICIRLWIYIKDVKAIEAHLVN